MTPQPEHMNGSTDEEMVQKKEKAIDRTERKRDIQHAITDGRSDDSFTDSQRLTRIEKKIHEAEDVVDDLASESLQLARRVVNLGRAVNQEEQRLIDFNSRISRMEDKTHKDEDEESKDELKSDKWLDRKISITTSLIFISLSLAAIIISLFLKM